MMGLGEGGGRKVGGRGEVRLGGNFPHPPPNLVRAMHYA